MKYRNLIYNLLILTTIFFTSFGNIFSQSSTTDTISEGHTYSEVNIWSGVQSHKNGGEQVYGGRFSYGLRRDLEVGINGSFSNPFDTDYPPEIQPSVKWKFYQNENYGVQAVTGAIAFIPITKKPGTDMFTMVYANASKEISRMKNARFTIGAYGLIGRKDGFGSKKGWNFNYEQPIAKKISFSTQWVTGKNRFGYVTPGFNISLTKNSSLFLGYSIGNFDFDNHGPFVSLGFTR